MRLFDPEGPVMSALGTFADLVFCNILFCLFSLPLFTVGASASALCDCALSLAEQREESFIAGQFWKAFRRNFRRGTALWLILLLGVLFLWAYSRAADALPGDLRRLYRVTFFVLLFLYAAGAQYVFPLQARFSRAGNQPSLWGALKTAWLLSAAALPWTLCATGIGVAAVWVSFFMNPAFLNTAVFLWAFAGFAVVAYLQSFFFLKAFRLL
ncbi:MAG: DUF624 domain-containing protein [Oscillibacter sp.]|nr:DUF624 domain-containing protein [Oscillibacter sp.]